MTDRELSQNLLMQINKIYNEDCLKTMNRPELQSKINLVMTSPPYNMTNRKGGYSDKHKRYDIYEDWKSESEYINFIINVFNGYDKILINNGCVLFNFSYSIENPSLPYKMVSEICNQTNFSIADTIIWKKPTSIPHPASKNRLRRICEFVFVFSRKNELETFETNKNFIIGNNGQNYYDIIDNFIEASNNDGSNNLNKATYSTELVRKLLLLYTKENDLIYDSFMGTGTTANACVMEKRNYLGSEISDKQCNYAEKRLNIKILQPQLF
jgi:site-specific DNA-methyltransferase (adenine-specific)